MPIAKATALLFGAEGRAHQAAASLQSDFSGASGYLPLSCRGLFLYTLPVCEMGDGCRSCHKRITLRCSEEATGWASRNQSGYSRDEGAPHLGGYPTWFGAYGY